MTDDKLSAVDRAVEHFERVLLGCFPKPINGADISYSGQPKVRAFVEAVIDAAVERVAAMVAASKPINAQSLEFSEAPSTWSVHTAPIDELWERVKVLEENWKLVLIPLMTLAEIEEIKSRKAQELADIRSGKTVCPRCKGQKYVLVSCPDGREGCCVAHTGACPVCQPKTEGKAMP